MDLLLDKGDGNLLGVIGTVKIVLAGNVAKNGLRLGELNIAVDVVRQLWVEKQVLGKNLDQISTYSRLSYIGEIQSKRWLILDEPLITVRVALVLVLDASVGEKVANGSTQLKGGK